MRLHQTPEEIIKAADPEQRIMWNNLFLEFGERISLSPLFYQGASAGSEFLVFKAGILYVAYNLRGAGTGAAIATNHLISLYDRNNVVTYYSNQSVSYFDSVAAAAKYSLIGLDHKNLTFSRLVLQNMTSLRFIGYRISY